MKEARKKGCCRNPRTTQERRLSCDEDHKPYVRAKRRKMNLPCSYDDIFPREQKSWKKKRRKQYLEEERKEYKYETVFLNFKQEQYVKDFFKQVGVVANFEEVRESYIRHEFIIDGIYRPTRIFSRYIKTLITFKSSKDIGFEIILDKAKIVESRWRRFDLEKF